MLSEENSPAGFYFIFLSAGLSSTSSQEAFRAGQSAPLSVLLGQLYVIVMAGKMFQESTGLPLGLHDYTFKRGENPNCS